MILNDEAISLEVRRHKLIEPFFQQKISKRNDESIVSYGLQGHGYDVRYSGHAIIHGQKHAGHLYLHPGEHALISTYERLRLPSDIIAHIYLKSTYARKGLILVPAAVDAGWEGHLTLSIYNGGEDNIEIRVASGIAQVQFQRVAETATPYNGYYANTEEPAEAAI